MGLRITDHHQRGAAAWHRAFWVSSMSPTAAPRPLWPNSSQRYIAIGDDQNSESDLRPSMATPLESDDWLRFFA